MTTGTGVFILVLALLVLIIADVVRTPADAQAGPAERPGLDPGLTLAAVRSGTGAHASPRDPAARNKPVAPALAMDEPGHGFDPMRAGMPQPAVGEAASPNKLNTMFVNLSRRSQALVERQLRLIESLEHGEQDMQRLASLSRLNRIAMRMHRNSQNLLVLAGQEPSSSWNQPVTLAHLVEAALSEIEDCERVSFEVQPDIAVRGPAVHDAVHLLVELIDNATSFSAADMPVHIKGQVLTSGGALIDITDHGIGMPAKEMAFANQQLDNPPPPDTDVPKWMGLLVVGRIALRHGIRIRLNQAELGGLTALVWFPDEILTYYAADPGYPAEQRDPVVSSAPFTPARTAAPETPLTRNIPPARDIPAAREIPVARDIPVTRAEPAWSMRAPQTAAQGEPAAAVRPSTGRLDVQAAEVGGQGRVRRLPIFDEIESRWSRGAMQAPDPSGPVPGALSAGALPRRSSPSTQAQPGTAPGLPPGPPGARSGAPAREGLTEFQHGAARGWPAPADDANPAPDES